jgi:hypothetical protein
MWAASIPNRSSDNYFFGSSQEISNQFDLFAPELWARMIGSVDDLQSVARALREPNRIRTRRSNRDESESVYEVEIEHAFPPVPPDAKLVGVNDRSYWLIGYNAARGVIDAGAMNRLDRVAVDTWFKI